MNEKYMEIALKLASSSGKDVPVGAVIVKNDKIVSIASNEREKLNDISAHAEILAIKKAEEILGNWRLNECELYVTLEPCPMCAWAIIQSRIKSVYFGSYDTTYGALGSKYNLAENSSLIVKGGIMEKKCDTILKDFFMRIRNDR